MPIYEYKCLSCAKTHEIWQKITDQPKKLCPICGGSLRKLLSMSSFSLKGGGWYADGYASVKPGSAPAEQNGSTAEKPQGKTADKANSTSSGTTSTASPPAG